MKKYTYNQNQFKTPNVAFDYMLEFAKIFDFQHKN